MNGHVFTSISDRRAADHVQNANQRVILAVPAIHAQLSAAITHAHERLGGGAVRVIVDCDEEVFRLGYGHIEAVKQLQESGCDVRQCAGLRIGVLVCDDVAWVFAPTALLVQPEVHSDETPNALQLCAADVERIVWRLSSGQRESAGKSDAPPGLGEDSNYAGTEIGHAPLTDESVAQTAGGLTIAPPLPFDVARQVHVFSPYIQYVDIHLTGCAIQRRRVEIPKSIQRVGGTAEIETRLKTTFDLIERSSVVSSKTLESELKEIRDDFTRALGKPWGRILLRSSRPRFDKRIEEFRKKLDDHRKNVRAKLKEQLDQSRSQVVNYYLPFVMKSPPDALLGQLVSPKPTDENVRGWLKDELSRVFPAPTDLIKDMRLDVQYRDVTYETLNEDGFGEALRRAFPRVNWDKPFDEYNAAKERS